MGGHTRSVDRPKPLNDALGSKGENHAPLFAKPPVVGSARHRLPPKYLGWSECARARAFSGLVVHSTLREGWPT
jgi:hypothetical protein